MGKRASTGGSKLSTPAKKPKDEEGTEVVALSPAKIESLGNWAAPVMEHFDQVIATHGSASAWLARLMAEQGQRSFAEALDANFPVEESVQYMRGYAPGQHHLRLWQLNFSEEAGNKGVVVLEGQRNLLVLMLANGVVTNPMTPGTEALVICRPNPVFWRGQFDCPALHADLVGIGGVAFVKGWTRALTAVTLACSLVSLELVDVVRREHPELFQSLCTLYGNLPSYVNELQLIDASRGSKPMRMSL